MIPPLKLRYQLKNFRDENKGNKIEINGFLSYFF
jgi:hypothetical protein